MPNRVQVSSAASGTPVAMTFGVNPSFYDASDSTYVSPFEVLHGASIYQKKTTDGRTRSFTWSGFPNTDANITAIVTYFRSIVGQVRYFNFQDIDAINNGWPNSNTWKKVRIVALNVTYRKGGALKYDTIELIFQPET